MIAKLFCLLHKISTLLTVTDFTPSIRVTPNPAAYVLTSLAFQRSNFEEERTRLKKTRFRRRRCFEGGWEKRSGTIGTVVGGGPGIDGVWAWTYAVDEHNVCG